MIAVGMKVLENVDGLHHLIGGSNPTQRNVSARDPFAMVMMSGSIPKCSMPNHLPVLPNPQMTSSMMSRIPYLSQISLTIFQYSFGGA